jgi:hypothetical protein
MWAKTNIAAAVALPMALAARELSFAQQCPFSILGTKSA